jgi:hypothetical protein
MMAAPCAENLLCSGEVVCAVPGDNHADEEQKDDCGTSCNCTCCIHIVSLSLQSQKTMNGKTIIKSNLFFSYDNISLSSNYFGNIWQPPRTVS